MPEAIKIRPYAADREAWERTGNIFERDSRTNETPSQARRSAAWAVIHAVVVIAFEVLEA